MQWQDVINDKSLQDLPYKIELNEHGNIVMSPASNKQEVQTSHLAAHVKDYGFLVVLIFAFDILYSLSPIAR